MSMKVVYGLKILPTVLGCTGWSGKKELEIMGAIP